MGHYCETDLQVLRRFGLFWLWVPTLAVADANQVNMTSHELVSAYERSLERTPTLLFKTVTDEVWLGDFPSMFPVRTTSSAEYRRDGNRIDTVVQRKVYRDTDALVPLGDQQTRVIFTDGNTIRYSTSSLDHRNQVLVSGQSDSMFARQSQSVLDEALILTGEMVPGNSFHSMIAVLKMSNSTKVRKQMEVVDGRRTYVLEAQTPYGHHTLWLDPDHGFYPKRIVIEKQPGDLMDDKPLAMTADQSRAYHDPFYPDAPLKQFRITVAPITVEAVDGLYFPTSATIEIVRTYTDGREVTARITYECNHIDLKPDFEAIGAFRLDVPDGIPVFFMDDPRADAGIRYEWRDGAPRPVSGLHPGHLSSPIG